MPTVFRLKGFRVYFYSHEPNEPPHVHIDKGGSSAKVWLEPVGLARNIGFPAKDINVMLTMVRDNREQMLEAWHGYFGSQCG